MKLYFTHASPYARKVRMVVREKGLQEQVEEIYSHPLENPPELFAANPLGKVPALVLDNGQVLIDSPLICEYLDTLGQGETLFPKGSGRWPVLQRAALADGVLDAAVALMIEKRKPEEQRSEIWCERYRSAMTRTLQLLDAHPPAVGEVNIATIGLAATLGYLLFRHPEIAWQKEHPALASWYQCFAERASMRDTIPS